MVFTSMTVACVRGRSGIEKAQESQRDHLIKFAVIINIDNGSEATTFLPDSAATNRGK